MCHIHLSTASNNNITSAAIVLLQTFLSYFGVQVVGDALPCETRLAETGDLTEVGAG